MERAAVLRVKRKRDRAVPAEALLLSCKRLRTDAGGGAASWAAEGDGVEKNLFKLVATVASEDEPVQKYVQEAISKSEAAQLLRPSLGSAERVIRDLRSSKQAKRQESRYRLIASHRPAFTDGESPVLGAHGKAGKEDSRSASKAKEDASTEEIHSTSDGFKEFQLFDIIQEEDNDADGSAVALQNQNDPDVILCNAVEMIRQRLTVSDRSKDTQRNSKEEDDYVFDIYYMETASLGWIEDILSVQPYTQDSELVDEERISEEIYEDEDDENSENNWRNDYPDEEELFPEESGEESELESNSDEDSGCIRTRWEKYQSDVLQEFEYDGFRELDSD